MTAPVHNLVIIHAPRKESILVNCLAFKPKECVLVNRKKKKIVVVVAFVVDCGEYDGDRGHGTDIPANGD